jgi:hypothetical protein
MRISLMFLSISYFVCIFFITYCPFSLIGRMLMTWLFLFLCTMFMTCGTYFSHTILSSSPSCARSSSIYVICSSCCVLRSPQSTHVGLSAHPNLCGSPLRLALLLGSPPYLPRLISPTWSWIRMRIFTNLMTGFPPCFLALPRQKWNTGSWTTHDSFSSTWGLFSPDLKD